MRQKDWSAIGTYDLPRSFKANATLWSPVIPFGNSPSRVIAPVVPLSVVGVHRNAICFSKLLMPTPAICPSELYQDHQRQRGHSEFRLTQLMIRSCHSASLASIQTLDLLSEIGLGK